MFTRIWYGHTTRENAAAFEDLLRSEVFPFLQSIHGFRGGLILNRDLLDEIEFVVVTRFDAVSSMRAAAASEEFGLAFIPEKAEALLSRYDKRTAVYSVVHEIKQE
jgi:antibiotic biosynthesis monooxygenase (ABM) superfamily enzyme